MQSRPRTAPNLGRGLGSCETKALRLPWWLGRHHRAESNLKFLRRFSLPRAHLRAMPCRAGPGRVGPGREKWDGRLINIRPARVEDMMTVSWAGSVVWLAGSLQPGRRMHTSSSSPSISPNILKNDNIQPTTVQQAWRAPSYPWPVIDSFLFLAYREL